MPEKIQWSASDSGCIIDGHWGQYGIARMIEIAQSLGYKDEITRLADIKMKQCAYPSLDIELTVDDEEQLSWAADEVEQWLNDNVAPEGYSFGWHDGEFFLWSTETWEEN